MGLTDPDSEPTELDRHGARIQAMMVLPDGRVAPAGDGRLLIGDLADPDSDLPELDRHGSWIWALPVLGRRHYRTAGHCREHAPRL